MAAQSVPSTRGVLVRTLNVQLAAILATIVVVFGGGSYFLHNYQIHRNAYVFKHEAEVMEEQAKEAKEKHDSKAAANAYGKALRNLSWYVRLVPTDIEAMEKLGLLSADPRKTMRRPSAPLACSSRYCE